MTTLERGVFTLSLDFELIWGTRDLFGVDGFREACRREREIVPRLLDLLVEHRISATWCVLGHLFLGSCDGRHAGLPRPSHAWHPDDWFRDDPGGTEESQPLFFARRLVEGIRAAPVPQEIGGHSFSHVIYGDAGCTREVAEADLRACTEAAAMLGITLRSFAFPRNRVGHLEALAAAGFKSYRGTGPRWYEQDDQPSPWARLAHLWEVMRASTPATVLPERRPDGLVNVPGSMIFFPAHGVRRWIPLALRVRRARKGLRDAVERRRVFHLWFHPTNLADRTAAMLAGLDEIFADVARLRSEGRLEVRTMGELAEAGAGAATRL